MKAEDTLSIVERHQVAGDGLISILEDIQGKHGYLPEAALREVAEQTGRSLVDVFGVATFYRAFSLAPRGKHLVAPVVTVDGHYFPHVKTTKVKEILEKAKAGLDELTGLDDERLFPVEVSCPRCNHSLIDRDHLVDGLPPIRVNAAFDHKHGWLCISSLYGSYAVNSEFEIPEDALLNFFCPHCHAELLGGVMCPECAAAMVPMIVRGGGIVQICRRRGCKGHILDV
jgi:hypothetical protein